MNNITILFVDDYSALYVNGSREKQSHDIFIEDLTKFCPIASIKTMWVGDKLSDYVLNNDGFPETLEECEEIGLE